MRLLFLMTVAVALACPAKGQTCTCESNFEWVKKTFEENDAGFQHIIDTKGQAAYDLHNQLMLEKIRASQNLSECLELLSEWLTFFRSCHQWIVPLTDKAPSAAPEKPETWNGNIAQFEEYINTKKEADYEGIWQTGNYKIGVKKENENYIGFIIEADVDGWREQGLVKLKIEQNGDKLKSTWYMRDYSPVVSGEPVLTGNNHLRIGNSALTRVNSTFPDDPLLEKYLKSITSQNPYLEELNENTLYLRIPSFNHSEKKEIDRVIAENEKKF